MALVWKLGLCILTAGATSCGLLVIRQHRIETAFQMSRIHHDLLSCEQRTWSLRVQVHERVRQDRVAQFAHALSSSLGVSLAPIVFNADEITRIEDILEDDPLRLLSSHELTPTADAYSQATD